MTTIDIISIALCIILITSLNPLGDGIRDMGNKDRQKYIEIVRDIMFFVLIFVLTKNFKLTLLLGCSHACLRLSIHNFIWNGVCDEPWWFSGTRSVFDRIERKINRWAALTARIVTFLFSLLLFWLAITKGTL